MTKNRNDMLKKILERIKTASGNLKAFFSLKLKRLIGLGAVSAFLIAVTASIFMIKPNFIFNEKKEMQTNDSMVMPEIKVYNIEKKQITEKVSTYGTISYFQKVNVSTKLEEVVDKVFLDIGDYVAKDQTIALLKNDYIKLGLELAKVELKGKEAALQLTSAKYNNAVLAVEKNIESLEQLKLQEKQKKLELVNTTRILSNKESLLDVGGITMEQYKEAENSFSMTKLQYESILKNIQVSEMGYRDIDIKNAGESVPSDKLKRTDVLVKINTKVEEAELNIAKTQLESAKLQLTSAELSYKESIIRSPVTGLIAMRYIEPGEKVAKDKPVFTVIDLESVYIELPVPETEIAQIKQNQEVAIKVDAYPLMSFSGIVETIYPMVDVKTRTSTIRCLIKNQRLTKNRFLLMPGMFVRANIVTSSKKDALTIPFEGMAEKENSQIKIFLIKRSTTETNIGVAVEKWVPFSKIAENYVEIMQDVNEGDTIAVSGLDFLETGMRVKLKEK